MSRVKQLLAGVLAGLLMTSGGITPALAAGGNVEYRGGAEGFLVQPRDDLFGAMKGLVPGAVAVEEIAVGNRSGKRCRLYLTAQGAAEDAGLLAELQLQLVLRAANGAQLLLYQGSASGGPQGRVHLGDYSAGSGATLVATLTVPETLDNRWQNSTGRLNWVFEAVELDSGSGGGDVVIERPPTVTPVPQTKEVLPATGSTSSR